LWLLKKPGLQEKDAIVPAVAEEVKLVTLPFSGAAMGWQRASKRKIRGLMKEQ
jgi:hypothetical protein